MVRLWTERSDTKSNVKLGGFRAQFQASYLSSHTEELWYNETVCQWMTIYIYIYIYIYTNLLSTSIHGYQEKEKKKQNLEMTIFRITAWGKKIG